MTKKIVFFSAIGFLIFGYAIIELLNKYYCTTGYSENFICTYFEKIIIFIFFFSIPVLLFSLITYFLRDEIFYSWVTFSKWMIPIATIIILITPSNDVGSSGLSTMTSAGFISLILFTLYVVISLIIILYKSIRLHGK